MARPGRLTPTALAGGVPVNALAAFLGHADPGFTLRVYAHLMPDADSQARAAIDAVLAVSATGQTSHGRGKATSQ